MFSSALNIKAVRVTTTGLIATFLAVCTLSVAPAADAAPATGTSQHAVVASSSGQSTQDDGFHW